MATVTPLRTCSGPVLTDIGIAVRAAVPTDPTAAMRRLFGGLGELAADGDLDGPAFTDALGSSDPHVVEVAAEVLASIAVDAGHAVLRGAALTAAEVADHIGSVTWAAAEALDADGIDGTSAVVDAAALIGRAHEAARLGSAAFVDLGDGFAGLVFDVGDGIVLDCFAGPGGWSEGARSIGIDDLGVEWDEWACATRAAAGHSTIRGDVAALDLSGLRGRVTGLISSPPCQAWSAAGSKKGMDDPRGVLIGQLERYAVELRPRWVAAEQVATSATRSVFDGVAATLGAMGYATWVGTLNAADFGVAQTRNRLFLMASRIRADVGPPEPTHGQDGPTLLRPDLARWTTMAEAVGWGLVDRPAYTIPSQRSGSGERLEGGSGARRLYAAAQAAGRWKPRFSGGPPDPKDIKAYAADGGTIGRPDPGELGVLQGFRPDYPWQGPLPRARKQQLAQIGNAVCPPVAARVIGDLVA
ncbi:DNA cytosine methyltransferase [Euzebya pacifica]|nr:DNA cytosine methyltransferase [Euzebya pacifica]